MNEIEALLSRDRSAPLPELPDPAFTTAAVARRLAAKQSPSPRERRVVQAFDIVPYVAAALTAMGAAASVLFLGLPAWWLLLEPLLLLPLTPILRKGVR